MWLRLAILIGVISFVALIGVTLFLILAPHAANYFYQKSIEDIQKSDYLQAKINYEKSLFLSNEFANPSTTGFIQVYVAYARDQSNKVQQDVTGKVNVSHHLNQAIRAYERVMSFKPPPNLLEAINLELAITYENCASKQVSCKYESDVVTNYKKAMDYVNKLGEHEEKGCMGLSLNNTVITYVGVNSSALKAGVQVHDRILSIDGTKVNSAQEIVNLGRSKGAGTLVTLFVHRAKHGEFAFQFLRESSKKCLIYAVESDIANFYFTLYTRFMPKKIEESDIANFYLAPYIHSMLKKEKDTDYRLTDYHLNEAIRHNPSNYQHYLLLAIYYQINKLPENEVITVLDKGIARLQRIELYWYRGNVYCGLNKKEKAVADYNKVISLCSRTDKEGKEAIEKIEATLKNLQCPPEDSK